MQSAPNQPTGPLTYTVGPQLLTAVPDGRGGFTQGYQISFTLSNGHMDQVTLPEADYSVAAVKAAIEAKAAQVAAVYGLAGTVPGS